MSNPRRRRRRSKLLSEIDEYLGDLDKRLINGELGTNEERHRWFIQAYTPAQRRVMLLKWLHWTTELCRVWEGRWPDEEIGTELHRHIVVYKTQLALLDRLH